MLICWASSWLRPQRQRNRSCRLCPLAHCFPGGRAAAAQGHANNAHQFYRELLSADALVNRQVVNSVGAIHLGRLPTYHTSRPTGRRSMVGFIRYLNGCRCESPPAIVSSRICSTANKSSVLCKSVHRSSD